MRTAKLAVFCSGLWLAGLVGMGVCRLGLGIEPGSLGFDVCAAGWAVGGLSYCLVASLVLLSRGPSEPEV